MEASFICLAASVLFLLAYITLQAVGFKHRLVLPQVQNVYSRMSIHNASLKPGTDLGK
jgi:hypothetical protein